MEDKQNILDKKQVYSNLNRENKLFGIVDYKTFIVLLIIIMFIWWFSGIIFSNLINRAYMLIITLIPVIGIFYSNKSSDNITHIVYCIIKYILSPKLYVYKFEQTKYWLK